MKITAIVPAAGSGKRMMKDTQTDRPKQFWLLDGLPILVHVLRALESSEDVFEIIIATRREYIEEISSYREKYAISKLNIVVEGGKERADSVYHAMEKVSDEATHILVQDGVRPFLNAELVDGMVSKLGEYDGIIAARPVVPTLKHVEDELIGKTVDRSQVWEAETPQMFPREILFNAYEEFFKTKSAFTDEASLVEGFGGHVTVFTPKGINTKITTLADYELAKRLKEGPSMTRVGLGCDIHRLVEGRKLFIGGVEVPHNKGCLGHSDGDPLLHAVIDALLGAAGLGDIGELFPDNDPQYKGISSVLLFEETMKKITAKGFRPQQCDVIIILERPKIKDYKAHIRTKLAELLGLDESFVNVKAKTNEECDSVGRQEAVETRAVVTLV